MKIKCWNCGHEFDGSVSYDELGWHSYCSECETSFDVDVVWICVYRDTIEELEEDWQTNLSEVLVTEDFARQYFDECKADNYDDSIVFENWIMNYDASDTEDFYDYAMKHNAVLDIDHWK